jgi:hypothetical protein
MEVLDNLPPVVTLVLALLLVIWLVLALLVPFMIESIRGSTRKTYLELAELNKKLEHLLAVLEKDSAARVNVERPAAPQRETRPAATRKEPTISA